MACLALAPPDRASGIGLALLLCAVPLAIIAGFRLNTWWQARSGADSFTAYHFVLVPGSMSSLILFVLIPPLLLVIAWWVARLLHH